MMAFKALGYSMNTEDPNEINDAYEWLLQMNNTMSPVYVTDEVIDGMMNGYKDIAVVYSGDAAVVLDENEDMSFYMPSQGTNIWCDAMVIPQNAENPKLAHEFINYMLTYEAAFDNTETMGCTSPNAEVFEEMTSSEDLYADQCRLPSPQRLRQGRDVPRQPDPHARAEQGSGSRFKAAK